MTGQCYQAAQEAGCGGEGTCQAAEGFQSIEASGGWEAQACWERLL